ncbi:MULTISPECIES: hypothetical protein [Microtetraspora]|uniref:ATP-grasp-modified RiPP n=1 Tax=Microtetraspora fusca TaxID=1997 RepID=A0ABW6VJL4_MICFU|nr:MULTISPECIES: hypothetical protein [Microtetraspora]
MNLPIQSAPVVRTINGAPSTDRDGAEQSLWPVVPIPGVPFADENDE